MGQAAPEIEELRPLQAPGMGTPGTPALLPTSVFAQGNAASPSEGFGSQINLPWQFPVLEGVCVLCAPLE